jgi:hypothetical protein
LRWRPSRWVRWALAAVSGFLTWTGWSGPKFLSEVSETSRFEFIGSDWFRTVLVVVGVAGVVLMLRHPIAVLSRPSGGSSDSSQLRIVKATWGANFQGRSAWRDVTDRVANKVAAGEDLFASNESLGGDPLPGVRKTLWIQYALGGKGQPHATFEEDDTVVLPPADTRFVSLSDLTQSPPVTGGSPVVQPMTEPPPPEWNTWTHKQACDALEVRLTDGGKIRADALTRLDPDSTWRDAERWIHETSDDCRRYAPGWVVAFGNVNDLKMVSPTDSKAIAEHMDDKLQRLQVLLGKVLPTDPAEGSDVALPVRAWKEPEVEQAKEFLKRGVVLFEWRVASDKELVEFNQAFDRWSFEVSEWLFDRWKDDARAFNDAGQVEANLPALEWQFNDHHGRLLTLLSRKLRYIRSILPNAPDMPFEPKDGLEPDAPPRPKAKPVDGVQPADVIKAKNATVIRSAIEEFKIKDSLRLQTTIEGAVHERTVLVLVFQRTVEKALVGYPGPRGQFKTAMALHAKSWTDDAVKVQLEVAEAAVAELLKDLT